MLRECQTLRNSCWSEWATIPTKSPFRMSFRAIGWRVYGKRCALSLTVWILDKDNYIPTTKCEVPVLLNSCSNLRSASSLLRHDAARETGRRARWVLREEDPPVARTRETGEATWGQSSNENGQRREARPNRDKLINLENNFVAFVNFAVNVRATVPRLNWGCHFLPATLPEWNYRSPDFVTRIQSLYGFTRKSSTTWSTLGA